MHETEGSSFSKLKALLNVLLQLWSCHVWPEDLQTQTTQCRHCCLAFLSLHFLFTYFSLHKAFLLVSMCAGNQSFLRTVIMDLLS